VTKAVDWFIKDGSLAARLVRTLVEVAISYFVAHAGDIFGLFAIPAEVKNLIIGFLVMVFTALLGFINDHKNPDEEYINSTPKS